MNTDFATPLSFSEGEYLSLKVKRDVFEKVITGELNEVCREITPSNEQHYIRYITENLDEYAIPLFFKTIKLDLAYTKGTSYALISVEEARIEIVLDENGREIEFEYKDQKHIKSKIIYKLGTRLDLVNFNPAVSSSW